MVTRYTEIVERQRQGDEAYKNITESLAPQIQHLANLGVKLYLGITPTMHYPVVEYSFPRWAHNYFGLRRVGRQIDGAAKHTVEQVRSVIDADIEEYEVFLADFNRRYKMLHCILEGSPYLDVKKAIAKSGILWHDYHRLTDSGRGIRFDLIVERGKTFGWFAGVVWLGDTPDEEVLAFERINRCLVY